MALRKLDLTHVTYALQLEHHGACALDAEIYIRIGDHNPVLMAWMASENIIRLAIITSTNPGGEVLPPAKNHERWAELVGVVTSTDHGGDFFLVQSRPGCGDQDFEMHMAVPDMTKDHAATIAARFGQIAFVFVERVWVARRRTNVPTCVPELVMVAPPCRFCDGRGQINGGLGPLVDCGTCHGSGRA